MTHWTRAHRGSLCIAAVGAAVVGLASAGQAGAQASGLEITISAAPSPAPPGQDVTFTTTTVNHGPAVPGFVQLNVLVPGTLESASSTASRPCPALNQSYVGCPLGKIGVGGSVAVTMTVKPAANGPLIFTAWTTSTSPNSTTGPVTATPRISSVVRVLPGSDPGPINPTVGIGGWGTAEPFQTSDSFSVAWSAVNPALDQSDVSGYSVRVRSAVLGAPFGGYRTLINTNALTWVTKYVGTSGSTYCFSVRATDPFGGASAWSPDACTTVPISASAMRLSTGCQGERSQAGSGELVRCSGARARANLAIRAARSVAVLLMPCRGCGRATVLWNGNVVERVRAKRSGSSPTVIRLRLPASATGILSLRPTSARKPVVLAGLGVSAA